jgi:hypothetical protein
MKLDRSGTARERLTQLSATIGNKLARGGHLALSLAPRRLLAMVNTLEMKSTKEMGTRIS